MSSYAWIIDWGNPNIDLQEEVGIKGPRGITPDQEEKLKAGEGEKFKMYDDDGIKYYEGRIIGERDYDAGFEPLDDFGMPNAGCTDIHYKSKKTGQFEVI
jgi:hypothetical protein